MEGTLASDSDRVSLDRLPSSFQADPQSFFEKLIDENPNMRELSLANCQISSLSGFEHLSTSEVTSLSLEDNFIANIEELKNLKKLFKLRSLNLAHNPCTSDLLYITEVFLLLPQLTTVDGVSGGRKKTDTPDPLNIKALLREEIYTDLDIIVSAPQQVRTFHAHRALLAWQSSKLKALIDNEYKHSTAYPLVIQVELPDTEIMVIMLKYCYGEFIMLSDRAIPFLLQLLEAANDYGLSSLASACESALCLNTVNTNVLELLEHSKRLGSFALHQRCMEVLSIRFRKSEPVTDAQELSKELLLDVLLYNVEFKSKPVVYPTASGPNLFSWGL